MVIDKSNSHSLMELEAPAPGDIFKSVYEHPDNVSLIEGDPRARTLSRNELKNVQQQIRDLHRELEAGRYYRAVTLIQQHENAIAALKIKLQDYREAERYNAAAEPAFANRIQKHETYVKDVSERIHTLKARALLMDRLIKRLKEHEIALANEALYKQLREEMRREVYFFAKQCIERWSALGFHQAITIQQRTFYKKVQFEKCVVTEDEIQFKIRVADLTLLRSVHHHLPHGVRVAELVAPETLNELSAACQRPVTSPHQDDEKDYSNGAYIVIQRMGMHDGLFNYIKLSDLLVKYNQGERERYPFPIGVRRGRVAVFGYLDTQPHLMFNGITGSGKTNAIRSILTTFIQYHSPDELRIIVTDLKRGADFSYFHAVPHMACPVMTELKELASIVWKLVALMRDRMKTIARRGQFDIKSYNASVQPENRMERVVLVIDECSAIDSLAVERDEAKSIWKALGLLATQARASGIHLMLGTQQAFSEAIPKNVRNNITFILSGWQRTLGASMSTFGDSKAKQLPSIPGRMYCFDGQLFQVQTPHAEFSDIQHALQVALTHDVPPPLILPELAESTKGAMNEFSADTVVAMALEDFGGALKVRNIHEKLSNPEISRNMVSDIVKGITANETYQHNDTTYRIAKQKGNFYKLIPLDT